MTPATFKAWRKRLGLTQSEAAAAIGISLRRIQDYERDAEIPRPVALACAAIAFGLPPYGEQQ